MTYEEKKEELNKDIETLRICKRDFVGENLYLMYCEKKRKFSYLTEVKYFDDSGYKFTGGIIGSVYDSYDTSKIKLGIDFLIGIIEKEILRYSSEFERKYNQIFENEKEKTLSIYRKIKTLLYILVIILIVVATFFWVKYLLSLDSKEIDRISGIIGIVLSIVGSPISFIIGGLLKEFEMNKERLDKKIESKIGKKIKKGKIVITID